MSEAAEKIRPDSPFSKLSKQVDLKSRLSIAYSARKGVQPKLFYDFAAAADLPESRLASLINVSARTISNYREKKKALDPVQSEHLLKLIALFEKGEHVFGNVQEFNYWLQKPFWDSKEAPLDWLITPGGVDLVTEELDRLSYGYVI
jgi:putative toxin-antitoxin system antitoxin component (TIGR02293 family)